MKTVCLPSFVPNVLDSKRTFLVNSILYEEMTLDPFTGYVFHLAYPEVAKDSLSIKILDKEKGIIGIIDKQLDDCFRYACEKKKNPIDYWAVFMTLGGIGGYTFLTRALNEKSPFMILKRTTDFYTENAVRVLEFPLYEELGDAVSLIDGKVGQPNLNWMQLMWFGEGEQLTAKDISEITVKGRCVADLAYSKLFSSLGYAAVPSHNLSMLQSYSEIFLKVEEELRTDKKIADIFRENSARESLTYLLGEKLGALNELLGFTPLNFLEIITKGVSNEQVDEATLKIRRDCKKIRNLFERVHMHCLKMEIDEAIEAKTKLADIEANKLMNFSILDSMNEFIDRKRQDKIHEYIDKMVNEEMTSHIVRAHKSLKKIKSKLGWVSEVKFLTFGALLVLASQGVDPSYVKGVLEALGSISLGSGAIGVTAKIIKEGMKLHPGFNIYGSFLDWPRIS